MNATMLSLDLFCFAFIQCKDHTDLDQSALFVARSCYQPPENEWCTCPAFINSVGEGDCNILAGEVMHWLHINMLTKTVKS